jgi:hypothetical protein
LEKKREEEGKKVKGTSNHMQQQPKERKGLESKYIMSDDHNKEGGEGKDKEIVGTYTAQTYTTQTHNKKRKRKAKSNKKREEKASSLKRKSTT